MALEAFFLSQPLPFFQFVKKSYPHCLSITMRWSFQFLDLGSSLDDQSCTKKTGDMGFLFLSVASGSLS